MATKDADDKAAKTGVDALQPEDQIEILHPETGQAYGVSVQAYHDLYEGLGYEVVRQGDGKLLPGDEHAPPPEAPAPELAFPEGETPEQNPAPPVVEPTAETPEA